MDALTSERKRQDQFYRPYVVIPRVMSHVVNALTARGYEIGNLSHSADSLVNHDFHCNAANPAKNVHQMDVKVSLVQGKRVAITITTEDGILPGKPADDFSGYEVEFRIAETSLLDAQIGKWLDNCPLFTQFSTLANSSKATGRSR